MLSGPSNPCSVTEKTFCSECPGCPVPLALWLKVIHLLTLETIIEASQRLQKPWTGLTHGKETGVLMVDTSQMERILMVDTLKKKRVLIVDISQKERFLMADTRKKERVLMVDRSVKERVLMVDTTAFSPPHQIISGLAIYCYMGFISHHWSCFLLLISLFFILFIMLYLTLNLER